MKKTLVGILAFVFVCGMGLTQAQKATPTTPETSVAPEAVEGPEIKFEKIEHNYGTIQKGANGDCEFEFVNTGTEPLILSNVQASCGCTTPSWPREPIAPGQKGIIKVHYDTNRIGGINKSITVSSNSVKSERIVLRITGTVNAG
ncbi:MAG: DUF1573 domain-containing protein [Bacteroidales bacterium]|jgi:hypothetical protein|nr:DUF1573 domain-containing protein [Bacteroidales bacterium]